MSKLSEGTRNLKFMQRATAKKAAAKAESLEPASVQDASSASQNVVKVEEDAAPSTSKLPSRSRPLVTTENSYLAFPILGMPGLGSTSNNGRMSFGKKEKARAEDQDMQDSDTDEKKPSRSKDTGIGKMREQPAAKGFVKPAGFDGLPAPIRQRGKQKQPVKQEEEDDEETSFSSDGSDGAVKDEELDEDAGFVDDFIESARQKRKTPIQAINGSSATSTNAPPAAKKKKVKQEKQL